MEAPLTNNPEKIINQEKTIEITSNKNHLYKIILINEGYNLFIKATFVDSIQTLNYEERYSLESIKKNPFFGYFESIGEILKELIALIDDKKLTIVEENKEINLIFHLPIIKIKEIKFVVKEKEKNDKDRINELFNIVANLKKENQLLKDENMGFRNRIEKSEKDIQELIKRIDNYETRINQIEIENKKVLEKKEKDMKLKNIDSNILMDYETIDFINKRLKSQEILKNKEIKYNLLYRASKDGDLAKTFHEKCDNKPQILAVFKTTKGFTFGGYTEIGYKGNGGAIQDNSAFFFSCDLKKIYNVKKGYTAIFWGEDHGPVFGKTTTIICVCGKMFDYNCCTCSVASSCFEGIESDYEITGGEANFRLQEIEVYQILYQ